MAVLPQNLDFTDRDFDSLRARLEALLRSVFPDWTDFQVANFGVVMMEMYAFVGGILNFYQDNQAAESRIVTASQRKNLIALAKLVGFKPSGNVAATAALTITLAAVPVGNFTLPIGQEVRTKQVTDPVKFQLVAVASIPAGTNPPTVTVNVENSKTQAEVFTSNALPNQEFELGEIPYIDDSLAITAADGVYTQVDNFLASTSTDKHFTVVVDQNDRATVKFGNGINGSIPQGTINATYKTGGGSVGNVEASNIEVIEGSFVDDLANPVQVTVTNALKASGGADRDTVEQIRQQAPEQLRVLNRTVSREDYEINAKKLSQVARALMTTSNEDPGVAENAGKLYVIPSGGGVPTQVVKDAVLTQVTITFPNTLTFTVDVVDPVFLTINVSARVFRAEGFTQADTRTAIVNALTSFFALNNADGSENKNVDFGFNFKDVTGAPEGEISWSTLLAIVEGVDAVRKIGDQVNDFALNNVDDDVSITVVQFPVLGTVTLIDGDSGQTF